MWDLDRIKKIKMQTDSISPSFCAMKWLHTTLHLHIGQTHSCYLPQSHHIPLDEIAKDPSALHNTRHKKQARKKMLKGERPSECSMCWAVEDTTPDAISDRLRGNAKQFARTELEELAEMPWNVNVNPRYLEVNFGNSCNLMCGYCSPSISTKWTEEIKKIGGYNLNNKTHYSIDYLDSESYYGPNDPNPYIDAFWKWWPSLRNSLHTLRITGGEPLMNKHAMRMLDELRNNPQPNLNLLINTNLCVSKNKIENFFTKLTALQADKCVKQIILNTSVESTGAQAEYMRTGLNFGDWENNLIRALDLGFEVMIMSTFNVLCVGSYKPLIDKIKQWRTQYSVEQLQWTNSLLQNPDHWSPVILTQKMHKHFDEYLNIMNDKNILDIERQHMLQIYNVVKKGFEEEKLQAARNDFVKFFGENDKRYGTNLMTAFPEFIGELAEWSKAPAY